MIVTLLVAAIVLVVICLVVRSQTEYQLAHLRTELFSLRSEEKRLAQEHGELEQMISQIVEALGRSERRRQNLREDDQDLTALLRDLYQEVKGQELDPDLLKVATEAKEVPVE